MKQQVFSGSACAIVTPFDRNLKIDYKTLKKTVEFQIEHSTDAIVVCGTTGESPVLNTREHKQIIKSVVKYVDGRVPVIAGTGGNNTQEVVRKCEVAQDAGADALLIVTPFYNKTSQDGLVSHYGYISRNTRLPIITYNVPSRTGVDIKPETYARLAELPNIVATKEANGSLSALMKTLALCGDKLDIYCGNDDQTAGFISMGAKGVISVLANIMPEEVHSIATTGLNGDCDLSTAMQLKFLEISNAMFIDVNPMPVKYAMSLMGLCEEIYRLPLTELSDSNKDKIRKTLEKYNLI